MTCFLNECHKFAYRVKVDSLACYIAAASGIRLVEKEPDKKRKCPNASYIMASVEKTFRNIEAPVDQRLTY